MARCTRREFLRRGAIGAGAVLAAQCGGGAVRDLSAEAARFDATLVCPAPTGLWPAELATRATNNYVDRSPRRDQYCFACKNFVAPPAAGTCGTCTTVKGPIHPLGWCRSWTEKRD